MQSYVALFSHLSILVAVRALQTTTPFHISWQDIPIPILKKQRRLRYVGMLDATLGVYIWLSRTFMVYDGVYAAAWILQCAWWEWQAVGKYKRAMAVGGAVLALRTVWVFLTHEYVYGINVALSFYLLYCSAHSIYALPI